MHRFYFVSLIEIFVTDHQPDDANQLSMTILVHKTNFKKLIGNVFKSLA